MDYLKPMSSLEKDYFTFLIITSSIPMFIFTIIIF